MAPVEEEPEALQDLFKYKLWVTDEVGHRTLGDPQPDPTERDYYTQLRALCRDLAETLSGVEQPVLPSDVVFVNGGEQDAVLMRATAEKLNAAGVAYTLPLVAIEGFDAAKTSANDVTQDLKRNLMDCDAMLLVHEKAPPIQIRQHLSEYVKSKARREIPPRAVAVCQTDPDRQLLGLSLKELSILSIEEPHFGGDYVSSVACRCGTTCWIGWAGTRSRSRAPRRLSAFSSSAGFLWSFQDSAVVATGAMSLPSGTVEPAERSARSGDARK